LPTGYLLINGYIIGAGVNLYGAYLVGADLTDANLTGAYLNGADLTDANLTNVTWSNTTCPDGVVQSWECPPTSAGWGGGGDEG
jgi:uncharacterized protein YjbI with pentapeptide repeats